VRMRLSSGMSRADTIEDSDGGRAIAWTGRPADGGLQPVPHNKGTATTPPAQRSQQPERIGHAYHTTPRLDRFAPQFAPKKVASAVHGSLTPVLERRLA
jgi:hypothetical protein